MPRILYIVPHRLNRSPGQRFRCEQYLPALREKGFDITYSNIISEKDDKIFYTKGNYYQKTWILFKSFFKRLDDVRKSKNYDIIFIYREVFMLGITLFERMLRAKNSIIIFDFDDAIWLNDTSEGNANLNWLKKPSKTASIIKIADLVLAGNAYLSQYAKRFNPRTEIMPTTIDTDYHKRIYEFQKKTSICIGWTGTSTTLKHFETIIPALKKIKTTFNKKIYFKVIVNFPYHLPELDIEATQWSLEKEIQDLSEIDIGIMPLPDDEWSKGKCGFKGLQYMSLEIATIMSPIGVNTEIIKDGENGFLASTEEEWVEKLSLLIEDESLRLTLGKKGRQTVEERYSVNALKNQYVQYFLNLMEIKKA
ncbi:MAG: glycosyl transferase family 1 [Bacteroidetes bacterium CG23_combo_of_CG06-09_8_20_14_all_32_9]|nr:MAG: glycosyl transferase family 1 [Bacteroidetes bacterium CG23_combo_of_CG06-09_8_20_14_all_32_9]